jgi:hypothetical protein
MQISGSMVSAASTADGAANMVGISMLKKSMDTTAQGTVAMLNSMPAPHPEAGHRFNALA